MRVYARARMCVHAPVCGWVSYLLDGNVDEEKDGDALHDPDAVNDDLEENGRGKARSHTGSVNARRLERRKSEIDRKKKKQKEKNRN